MGMNHNTGETLDEGIIIDDTCVHREDKEIGRPSDHCAYAQRHRPVIHVAKVSKYTEAQRVLSNRLNIRNASQQFFLSNN